MSETGGTIPMDAPAGANLAIDGWFDCLGARRCSDYYAGLANGFKLSWRIALTISHRLKGTP